MLRLKTDQGTMELPLRAEELEEALAEAEQLYADARVVANGKRRCQQCIHWKRIAGVCDFGFPEAKRTGGKHAQDCMAYCE
jgi:hypothetical protein